MEPIIYLNENNSRLVGMKNYFSTDLFESLNALPFNIQPEIRLFGKICRQKRDVLFISDVSEGYKYSGQMAEAKKFGDVACGEYLKQLLEAVNKSLNTKFNGILINRYVDGNNLISAHSDSETGLDPNNSTVASISFGATRTFRIKNKVTKELVCDVEHENGMLLLMQGEFQKHYTHEIPRQKTQKGCRISLTFRTHED